MYNGSVAVLVVKGRYLELSVKVNRHTGAQHSLRFRLQKDLAKAIIRICALFGCNLEPRIRFYCRNVDFFHLVEYDVDSKLVECLEVECDESQYDLHPVQQEWLYLHPLHL